MKKSLVFRMCGLLCSLFLLSPTATCLSLRKLEKRDIPNNNKEPVDINNSQSYPNSLLPSNQSTVVKDVNKSVNLPNVELAVLNESQNNSRVLINVTINPNAEESPLGIEDEAHSNSETKTSIENSIQTTDYTTTVTSLSIRAQEDPKESNQPLNESTLDLNQTSLENASQVNTMEMLTTNPRTNILKREDEFTTAPHLISEPATSGNVLTSESPMSPENSTLVNENSIGADNLLSQFSEDWDDTKVRTVGPNTVRSSDVLTLSLDQVLGNDSSEAAVFTILPGVTVPSDDKSVFSAAINLPQENVSFEFNESGVVDTVSPIAYALSNDNLSTALPSVAVDGVQSQDFSTTHTAESRQPDSSISDNSDVTVTTVTFTDVTNQHAIGEATEINKAGETVVDSAAPQGDLPIDESITIPTPQVLPTGLPITEDLKSQSEGEDPLVSSVSPVLPEAPKEANAIITSAPQLSVIVPPTRRITSTTPYGVEKLESEEGDDEDEEEEEDDDDDEGDEDDEEDDEKENESVDDSAEKDSDMPLFTLPGLSSQEPLEDERNVALIEGAAYQVPDTMEWEQQNQGLVRSWMEKLKDKAGYMSGMLVPVGVGIAGALLILGALYSIKIMNRRRRNGFKRHKRKQREFNSMQDRVMLLADSSEDEF